jgi:ABC-2 type transport system ATP-binding protein
MDQVAAIETELLTKFSGGDRGIEELTIAVEQGEVFGFLGPNGAGKTMTIRTLGPSAPNRWQRPHLWP